MKLTRKMIDDGKSDRGAWSANQLAILGVPWPPVKGWPERIIGTDISEADYQRFLSIRKKKAGDSAEPKVPALFTGDRNVEAVKAKMDARARLGFTKYGVTTERPDLTLLDWLRHAQMESMDQVIYLEAAIQKEEHRLWLEDEAKAEKILGQIFSPESSPEDFANDLFRETGGKLD